MEDPCVAPACGFGESRYQPARETGQGPFSLTATLDVTSLAGRERYPALLWLLAGAVNRRPWCRLAHTPAGLRVYDHLDPAYTLFHRETGTFSVLWTAFQPKYSDFLAAYRQDVAAYGGDCSFFPQGARPENTFDVSMVPWLSFSAFHLYAVTPTPHLLPIFTLGRERLHAGRAAMPLALQFHPEACQLAQVGELVREVQASIHRFPRL